MNKNNYKKGFSFKK